MKCKEKIISDNLTYLLDHSNQIQTYSWVTRANNFEKHMLKIYLISSEICI